MTKEEAKAIYYPISGVNLSSEKDLIDLIYDSFESKIDEQISDLEDMGWYEYDDKQQSLQSLYDLKKCIE